MKLHASIVPYSSIAGQLVRLKAPDGSIVAIVSISIPRPSLDYRTHAVPIAEKIVEAFNREQPKEGE